MLQPPNLNLKTKYIANVQCLLCYKKFSVKFDDQ